MKKIELENGATISFKANGKLLSELSTEVAYKEGLDFLAGIRSNVLADRHFNSYNGKLLLNLGVSAKKVELMGVAWMDSFRAGFMDGFYDREEYAFTGIKKSDDDIMFFNKRTAYGHGFGHGVEFRYLNK